MAYGQIVFSDGTGLPIFSDMDGHSDMPLYARLKPHPFGTITIHWEDGDDLDIFGYWTDTGGSSGVGWAHSQAIDLSGKYATWGGDNTHGGPETIEVGTDEDVNLEGLHTYRIHFNWYRAGTGHSGGSVHVVATGRNGTRGEAWGGASHRAGTAANGGDPYIDVVYDAHGLVYRVG